MATKFGTIEDLSVPRVREGSFRPSCLPPYRRRSLDLEEVIIAMYRGGLSTRDISKFLENLYGTRYSPAGISRLTDVLEEEIEVWRKRPLKEYYPVLYIDATFLPVRRGKVEKESCYIALGIDEDGKKEILGFWMSGSNGESSLLWQEVLETLRERGLRQVLLIAGDGLTGLREAAKKVYPKADFQSCVLHKVRASLNKVRRRDREKIARDLKRIYQVNNKKEALSGLENLEKNWKRIYPELVESWRRDFSTLSAFLDYPEEIRASIYTINILERANKEIKRRTKTIEVFSYVKAIEKILYLISTELNEKWSRRVHRGFIKAKPILEKMRRERYAQTQNT